MDTPKMWMICSRCGTNIVFSRRISLHTEMKKLLRYDQGPPETVTLLGHYQWPIEDIVVKGEIEQVPFFNAPIYMANKQQIGKTDEIFSNIRKYYVSVKLESAKASNFEKDTQLYIDPEREKNYCLSKDFYRKLLENRKEVAVLAEL